MKNPECMDWYQFANMDLQAAKTLDAHTLPKPSEIICYHCQQFAEKMLKGFLISENIAAPRTHDVALLCEMCIDLDERFQGLKDICKFLTLFGVLPRYPNELEILATDAERALAYARQMLALFIDCGWMGM